MKKLLTLLLTLLPIVANAFTGDAKVNGIWYHIVTKGGIAEVIQYKGTEYSGDIVIPETIEYEGTTCQVTSIGYRAFFDCRDLTSISIPEGVTSIGELAFYYCKELSSVVIPNSVTSIGEKAFFYCSKINSLTISNSITELPEFAFEGCSSLISVTIPESVNKIGARAFNACSSLQSVVIPNSVTVIGEYAFCSCKSLTSIKIPENAFLSSYAFRSCSSLTSVTIPNGVSFMGFSVFDYCSKLKTITIGKGIKKIQGEAFAYCGELTDVYCYSSEVPETWSNVFTESYPEFATLHVPSSSLEAYSDKSPWKDFGSKVKLPEVIYMVDNELYSKDLFFIGEHITPIEEPEKEGHTFSGWSDIPETMPNEDVTITGSFTVNSYMLTYLVDGEVYKTCEVKYGTVISPEDYPTKIGYSFSGWVELPSTMPAHDVTVNGTFTINKYKLTYIVDNEEYKTVEVDYNSKITPEAEPTKEGHTFSGWSEIPETMPANDVTVTGNFTVNSYNLTYIVDDVVYKTYEVKYGTTITPEEEPTKTGYSFSGWSEFPSTMPAKDITITGSFIINKYKLIYFVDGIEYKSLEVEYNASISPETEPTKEGHTFSGWSEIPETMPANDVIITGTFTINKYLVTYIIDGETFTTEYVEYASTITPPSVPEREGYSFAWNEYPETMPANDISITGQFTINSYKLSYFVDGAEYKSYDVVYKSTITPEAEPTKEGHTFSGWSEIPETMPANDVTITGSFIVNKYKVTYIIDGEVFATDYVEYGTTIVPPTVSEKEGFSFDGWADVPETMPAHDVTIYGSYTSGIAEIIMDSANVRMYNINGKRIYKLQRGINIIISKDGKVRKVNIK